MYLKDTYQYKSSNYTTSSITVSSQKKNDDEYQLRNCHLILKNVKRQKASLVESIKRNRELRKDAKVLVLNQKLDEVEATEFAEQDKITAILSNRNRKYDNDIWHILI